jgi:hypothetical protein
MGKVAPTGMVYLKRPEQFPEGRKIRAIYVQAEWGSTCLQSWLLRRQRKEDHNLRLVRAKLA